jgi:hypothetical protein
LPSKSRQGQDFLFQRVVGRDRYFSRTIHLRHLFQEGSPMIRSPLQEIKLPLMNHFMSNGVQEFLFRIGRSGPKPREEWKRQANFPTALSH